MGAIASICRRRSGVRRDGEWISIPPASSRMTVVLTGIGITPMAFIGPLSTIQTPSATGFSLSSGG